jgi:predicted PurR-regulated permease PerM
MSAAQPPEQLPILAESTTDTTPKTRTSPEELVINLPSWRTVLRWALVIASIYVVGWLLIAAGSSMLPFIIGLVFAYLLMPMVNRLNHWMPRWLAILTVYVGNIVIIILAFIYVAPTVTDQFEALITNFPTWFTGIQTWATDMFYQYQDSVPLMIKEPLEEGLMNTLNTLQTNISSYLQNIGSFLFTQVIQVVNTVMFLIGFLIIPIWMFYILNDVNEGRVFINKIVHHKARADFWNFWGMIDTVFSSYIRGQLILGLAVGAMVGIMLLGLQLFGINIGSYILLLAIIAGITELIPIIGPIIGAVPGVIIGFTISPVAGLAILAVYIIVQQLENNLLVPRIIGESVGIHPAILTVVLIAMGEVFGLLGVILSAPISAIARDLFIYTYRRLEGSTAADSRLIVEGHEPIEEPVTE